MEIFHEETSEFLMPENIKSGDLVNIVLQSTASSEDQWECFICQEVFKKGEKKWFKIERSEEEVRKGYRYTKFQYKCEGAFLYLFKMNKEGENVYYGKNGLQLTLKTVRPFYAMADYCPPNWARGAIWYQIMPDSFFNGCLLNDKTSSGINIENAWGNTHFGGQDYFGGDLKGIIKKLPYIQTLGVNIISINPIWLTTHQAGYGAYDPTQIDSAFGNEQDLIDLVQECHKRNIKVVLDAVFQYFNNEGIWSNDSKYFPLSAEKYQSIFIHDLAGKRIESPWKAPLVDFSADLARDLIYRKRDSILQKYLCAPYNCDGWRLDVGNIWEGSDPAVNGNSEEILKDIRNCIKSISADKLVLTEHDCGNMMQNYTLDSKWNYDLGWKLRDWVEGKISAEEMAQTIRDGVMDLPRAIADCSYNHLTTHDTKRIKRHAGNSRSRLKAGVLLYMTIPGSPCIYFGDEIGMEGVPLPGMTDAAPVSFSSMNWNEEEWDREIYNLYCSMGALRKSKKRLFERGTYRLQYTNNHKKLIAFTRNFENDFVLTVLNQSEKTNKKFLVDLRNIGISQDLTIYDYLTGESYDIKEGVGFVDVPAGGSIYTADLTPSYLNDLRAEGKVVFKNDRYIFCEQGRLVFRTIGNFRYTFKKPKNINIVLRENSKKEITIQVLQNKICVYRNAELLFQKDISNPKAVIAERDKRNKFCLKVVGKDEMFYSFENKTDLPQTPEMFVEGRNGSETGIAAEKTEQAFVADFSAGASCLFDIDCAPQDCIEYCARGVIIRSDKEVYFRSRRGYKDFCWTASFTDISGKAGIFAGENQNNCIALYYQDGQTLCSVFRDGMEDRLVSQGVKMRFMRLEKTGTRYRCLVSADGERYKVLAENVPCNYSELSVGLLFSGKVVCEYAAYGSGLKNADRENDPVTLNNRFTFNWKEEALNRRHLRWICKSGKWRYTFSGIEQLSSEGGSLCSEYEYKQFKLEFTFQKNTNKTLQIIFAPYSIAIGQDGQGVFLKDGQVQKTFQAFHEKRYRYLIVRDTYGLKLYAGQHYELLFGSECGLEPAQVQICGTEGTFCIYNYNLFHTEQEWTFCRGDFLFRKEGLEINSVGYDTAFCMYSRFNPGSITFSANLKAVKSAAEKVGYADFVFGNSVGSLPEQKTTVLRIGFDKKIQLFANGNEIAQYSSDELDLESFSLAVAVQNGRVCVWLKSYLGANQNKIIDCDSSEIVTGGLTVCVKGGKLVLCHSILSEGWNAVSDLEIDRGRYIWLS